jgi:hypothetical protein
METYDCDSAVIEKGKKIKIYTNNSEDSVVVFSSISRQNDIFTIVNNCDVTVYNLFLSYDNHLNSYFFNLGEGFLTIRECFIIPMLNSTEQIIHHSFIFVTKSSSLMLVGVKVRGFTSSSSSVCLIDCINVMGKIIIEESSFVNISSSLLIAKNEGENMDVFIDRTLFDLIKASENRLISVKNSVKNGNISIYNSSVYNLTNGLLYSVNSNVDISSCVLGTISSEGDGGAIELGAGSSFSFVNTYFSKCVSLSGMGGAIYIKDNPVSSYKRSLMNCTFLNNSALNNDGNDMMDESENASEMYSESNVVNITSKSEPPRFMVTLKHIIFDCLFDGIPCKITPPSPSPNEPPKSRSGVIAGVVVGVILVIILGMVLLVFVVRWLYRRRLRRLRFNESIPGGEYQKDRVMKEVLRDNVSETILKIENKQ